MTISFGRARARCGLAACLGFVVFASAPVLPSGSIGASSDDPSLFELEIPELGRPPSVEALQRIPSASLTRLVVHIREPLASKVEYGAIRPKLNADAVATVTAGSRSQNGKRLEIRLDQVAMYRLVPGRNVLEVEATDVRGRVHYANFVLVTSTDNRTNFEFTVDRVEAAGPIGTASTAQAPPDVVLEEPEGDVVVPGSGGTVQVRVAGQVTSAAKISSVTVDGVAVGRQPSATSARSLVLSADADRWPFAIAVKARAGTTIAVVATDASGNRTTVRIPVRTAEPAEKFQGRKYALLVGISAFEDSKITQLKYADDDARAVRSFLQTPRGGGFAAEDTLVLVDRDASLSAVRRAMSEFVSRAKPDDLLVIFLATHGTHDPYAPQNLYFVASDTKVNDIAGTGYSMTEFYSQLQQNCRARRMVLFVDACHSAGIIEPVPGARLLTHNLVSLYAEKLLYAGEGKAVLTASDVSESSLENAKWGGGHGVFTHFVLKGLGGKADRDRDGLVTVEELFGYVRQSVRTETEFKQNPRLLVSSNGRLALSTVAQAPPRRSGKS